MALLHLPVWTWGNIAVTAMQLLNSTAGLQEASGENAGYSKFAHKDKNFKVPTRLAMLTLYSPACLVALYAMLYLSPTSGGNGREVLVCGLVAVHFAKRILEVLFVHKYSGTMDGDIMCVITLSYTISSMIITYQQRHIDAYSGPWDDFALWAGLNMFSIGQVGNLYHHVILANLRKEDGEQKYVLPSGGLFRFVTTPHYFFELVAWFGVACVSQQLNVLLVAAGMTSYLSGRAVATTRWYQSKFADYPAERRHLVPFLF